MSDPRAPALPPPPPQEEDTVNDLGWVTRGPSRRAERAAAKRLEPLLLREGEDSGLPPDPQEAPPLPPPPAQEPDVDTRGRRQPDALPGVAVPPRQARR